MQNQILLIHDFYEISAGTVNQGALRDLRSEHIIYVRHI